MFIIERWKALRVCVFILLLETSLNDLMSLVSTSVADSLTIIITRNLHKEKKNKNPIQFAFGSLCRYFVSFFIIFSDVFLSMILERTQKEWKLTEKSLALCVLNGQRIF